MRWFRPGPLAPKFCPSCCKGKHQGSGCKEKGTLEKLSGPRAPVDAPKFGRVFARVVRSIGLMDVIHDARPDWTKEAPLGGFRFLRFIDQVKQSNRTSPGHTPTGLRTPHLWQVKEC